ncbi:asparagine synthase-related protein [Salinisphaera aquimarina]|uniref:Asparagine synthase-related protein n=1 Tax=Salinisphaera aquimarina TaxID=2094031 RepID=A0ABV7EIW5_9GAMM
MSDRFTDINGLLHYGYFVDWPYEPPKLPFSQATLEAARDERSTLAALDESALCDHGIRLWKQVCRRLLDSRSGPFVVPLSAGLDSRAILAGMADQGAPNLQTVTFGVPGSFDYEIAPDVARQAATPHERIDLRTIAVETGRIDGIVQEPGRSSFLLDMYFNRAISDRYGPDCTYLSGYVGDVLAGKNLRDSQSVDWEQARSRFAHKNRHSRTATLTHPDAQTTALLPEHPYVSADLMAFDEQLDYAVRQECLMRPIVMRPDYDSIAPMLDEEWVIFMLALSRDQRQGRRLFVQLFQRGFPALFSLPTTANGGLPLTASARAVQTHQRRLKRRRRLLSKLSRLMPSITVPLGNRSWQYIDFKQGLNKRADLTALFDRGMQRIDRANWAPWIDAQGLLREHRDGVADHGKALSVLLNLDIVTRAGALNLPPVEN